MGEEYNGNEQFTTPLAKGPTIGAWSLVDMMIDFDRGNVTVKVDGTPTVFAMHNPLSGAVSCTVGVYGSGSVAATTTHFDNVVFDGK